MKKELVGLLDLNTLLDLYLEKKILSYFYFYLSGTKMVELFEILTFNNNVKK